MKQAAAIPRASPAQALLPVVLAAFVTSSSQAMVSILLSGSDLVPLPARRLNAIGFAVDPASRQCPRC